MSIRVLRVSNRQYAHIEGIIISIVKEAIKMPLEESLVVRVIVVHTYEELECDNGMVTQSNDSVVVVIDQEGNLKGSQVFYLIA
eukprot:Gb_35420 [translate_table: standard]